MPSRCAILIWEAITILEAESQARVVDVLDSRWAQRELGKSSSRSWGDATGITLPLSTPLDPKVYRADLAKRRKGFLGGQHYIWRSSCEDCMETKEQFMLRCSCLLVRWFVAGYQPKCFSKRRWSVAQGLDAVLMAGWLCWSLWCSSCGLWCCPAQPEWPSWLHSQCCGYQNADYVYARMPSLKHCSMHLH